MYHDEFATRSARDPRDVGGPGSRLAIELGGGVAGAFATSIALPDLPILYSIGGLLPMFACCLGMIVDRCSGLCKTSFRRAERLMPAGSGRPIPAPASPSASLYRGPRVGVGRPTAARAGFDRSRRLG